MQPAKNPYEQIVEEPPRRPRYVKFRWASLALAVVAANKCGVHWIDYNTPNPTGVVINVSAAFAPYPQAWVCGFAAANGLMAWFMLWPASLSEKTHSKTLTLAGLSFGIAVILLLASMSMG